MTEYLIQQETLVDIANSIREKTGTTEAIVTSNMAASIRSIITNGVVTTPVETTMVSQKVTVEENTNAFVTLLSENSFALEHRTDNNLFVLFTPSFS